MYIRTKVLEYQYDSVLNRTGKQVLSFLYTVELYCLELDSPFYLLQRRHPITINKFDSSRID